MRPRPTRKLLGWLETRLAQITLNCIQPAEVVVFRELTPCAATSLSIPSVRSTSLLIRPRYRIVHYLCFSVLQVYLLYPSATLLFGLLISIYHNSTSVCMYVYIYIYIYIYTHTHTSVNMIMIITIILTIILLLLLLLLLIIIASVYQH